MTPVLKMLTLTLNSRDIPVVRGYLRGEVGKSISPIHVLSRKTSSLVSLAGLH